MSGTVYDGEEHKVAVLQVVPTTDFCLSVIKNLQNLIDHKHFGPKKLIKELKNRVKYGRAPLRPISMVTTDDNCSSSETPSKMVRKAITPIQILSPTSLAVPSPIPSQIGTPNKSAVDQQGQININKIVGQLQSLARAYGLQPSSSEGYCF